MRYIKQWTVVLLLIVLIGCAGTNRPAVSSHDAGDLAFTATVISLEVNDVSSDAATAIQDALDQIHVNLISQVNGNGIDIPATYTFIQNSFNTTTSLVAITSVRLVERHISLSGHTDLIPYIDEVFRGAHRALEAYRNSN